MAWYGPTGSRSPFAAYGLTYGLGMPVTAWVNDIQPWPQITWHGTFAPFGVFTLSGMKFPGSGGGGGGGTIGYPI